MSANDAEQELAGAHKLAARMRERAQFEDAESILRDGLQKAEEAGLGDSERVVEPLLLLARICRQNEHSTLSVADARNMQRRALSLAEASGSIQRIVDVLQTIGVAEWMAGDKQEALAAMEAARVKAELEVVSPAWRQYHMSLMAECAETFGDPHAVDYACASVELADRLTPGSRSSFMARFTLGRVRLMLQDAIGALEEFQRARDSLTALQQRTAKPGGRMLAELESWIERANSFKPDKP
jgi:hypothetical protein